jgi:hypothetical protein
MAGLKEQCVFKQCGFQQGEKNAIKTCEMLQGVFEEETM